MVTLYPSFGFGQIFINVNVNIYRYQSAVILKCTYMESGSSGEKVKQSVAGRR